MSFQNALHEALVGLKGGDGWFSDKFFAAALRERGMSSVDAQDISRLCKNNALKTHNDLGSTTGFHTRRYDGARFYQIKDPGKDGTMSMWRQEGSFGRRQPFSAALIERVQSFVAAAAQKRAKAAEELADAAAAAATGGASHAGASSSSASSSSAAPALRARTPATLPPWANASLAPATWPSVSFVFFVTPAFFLNGVQKGQVPCAFGAREADTAPSLAMAHASRGPRTPQNVRFTYYVFVCACA